MSITKAKLRLRRLHKNIRGDSKGVGRIKLDINNEYHQLIIGACANLITEEGYTAREVLELLESAKSDLWSALKQIEIEVEE